MESFMGILKKILRSYIMNFYEGKSTMFKETLFKTLCHQKTKQQKNNNKINCYCFSKKSKTHTFLMEYLFLQS